MYLIFMKETTVSSVTLTFVIAKHRTKYILLFVRTGIIIFYMVKKELLAEKDTIFYLYVT